MLFLSLFFQADNLKKSLVEVNDNSSPSSVKSRLQQVSDLEAEVAAVDEEIANLKKETESNAKSLIRRKVHHINTLQQLGKDPDSGEIFYGILQAESRSRTFAFEFYELRKDSLEANVKWRMHLAVIDNFLFAKLSKILNVV